jgi:hypothetical protein
LERVWDVDPVSSGPLDSVGECVGHFCRRSIALSQQIDSILVLLLAVQPLETYENVYGRRRVIKGKKLMKMLLGGVGWGDDTVGVFQLFLGGCNFGENNKNV